MTELKKMHAADPALQILTSFVKKVQALAEAEGIQITLAVTRNDLVSCAVHTADRDAQYSLEAALLAAHRLEQCQCFSCTLSRRALGLPTTTSTYGPVKGAQA